MAAGVARTKTDAGLLAEVACKLTPAAMPETVAPMLCTLVVAAFDSPDWSFEPKFDGLRVLARFDGRTVTLLSRNNKHQGTRFPEIIEGLRESLRYPAIVDGEIVCLDEEGRTSFRTLQQRFHLDDPQEIRWRMERHPAYLYLFDILYLDRFNITHLPLGRRRELLREAVTWSNRIRPTEWTPGQGRESLRRACEASEEGIVGKRLDSPYLPGRSDAWLKIKCIGRQEFVVGGWTDPQRSRIGLGALLVGYYEGDHLRYAGKVGTGYTRTELLDLRQCLDGIGQKNNPFDETGTPSGEGIHWVAPKLVAEIAFAEWTQNGLLRQPRYEGLRPDKSPHECRRESPAPTPIVRSHAQIETTKPTQPKETGMALEEYRAKRNFERTSEPTGAQGLQPHKKPIFVVQEHHASTLHYDFRLEADGVLKSWAVPKGPSLDPAVKRLAVQVEDHPLSYATFEGTIPGGQYGAGKVTIWDQGNYESLTGGQSAGEAIEGGRIEFVMHGEQLKGKFVLLRMKERGKGKPQWLLFKSKDEFATEEGNEPEGKPNAAPAPKLARPIRVSRAVKAPAQVELTHAERVIFPDLGITKKDVFAYYEKIAELLLPFLKDRPVTLERLPEGLTEGGPHFWQKNTPDSYPDWIPRIELETEAGKPVKYALVNNEATLLYLVNQGTLTFHPWLSRLNNLDRPDFVLLDLDPGKATFLDVVAVAKNLKAVLDESVVQSFVKTSGKTGLHILMPWTQAGGFDEARAWALAFAKRTVERMPDRATVDIRKAKRGSRVYIDVLQNARGHHVVPPYVLRAVPGATISTPLRWREVTEKLDPSTFTLKKVRMRLARLKNDPVGELLRMLNGQRTGNKKTSQTV